MQLVRAALGAWIGPIVGLALAGSMARGDDGPVPNRVYQRDGSGLAAIAINAPGAGVELLDPDGKPVPQARMFEGMLRDVPTGGPYTIVVKPADASQAATRIGPIFVGDLWVLAGQSNMEGYGDLVDVAPPNPKVLCLGMDGRWTRAEEPLHWLVDSPDPVHSGDPKSRAGAVAQQHRERKKGSGLGLPFATAIVEATGVPIGLIACAHGGTSLAQWDPAKKGEGGMSLYGSMIRQLTQAGGKVKGLLWYQGESDAITLPEVAAAYAKTFAAFIAAVRADLKQPELPFYYVQIGRFVNPSAPAPGPWNVVQDQQRRLVAEIPHTAVVATIDLDLDDLIHVGTPSLKRLGRRLANVALKELYDKPGGTTPTLDTVTRVNPTTLRLTFRGVNTRERSGAAPAGLRPARHIAGFSIRGSDGTELPVIYEAEVDPKAPDAVLLKLVGSPPAGVRLWYGFGLNPYCNLRDALDMAVPVFGPVLLDEVK